MFARLRGANPELIQPWSALRRLLVQVSVLLLFLDAGFEVESNLILIPSDKEYVRYISEGHLVTCNGTDEENMKWLTPDGNVRI